MDDVSGSIQVAPARKPSTIWHIGARELPLPHGASDALRDSIGAGPQPDLSTDPGLPTDEASLRALVEEADAMATERARMLRDHVGASVLADVIAGVNVFHVTPAEIDPRHEGHLFVYVHGGAFVLNAGEGGNCRSDRDRTSSRNPGGVD